MATRSFCDGCSGECADAGLTTVGRYDACVFCPDCLTAYRALEAAERTLHVQLVRDFEVQRAKLRADAKAAGLARLPDEE